VHEKLQALLRWPASPAKLGTPGAHTCHKIAGGQDPPPANCKCYIQAVLVLKVPQVMLA
jgi:hypothetical protein